jgi:hypothetical protein
MHDYVSNYLQTRHGVLGFTTARGLFAQIVFHLLLDLADLVLVLVARLIHGNVLLYLFIEI